ncbi:TIGR00341 family protein, partial [Rhodococcus erythropolis]|nr:TIGR00341 family protein [Rhodococcus erythropolis]
MNGVVPQAQRRTLAELDEKLNFSVGDRDSKRSAFWVMLTLSAVIAVAGVVGDSTATVIGAMIVAPLST